MQISPYTPGEVADSVPGRATQLAVYEEKARRIGAEKIKATTATSSVIRFEPAAESQASHANDAARRSSSFAISAAPFWRKHVLADFSFLSLIIAMISTPFIRLMRGDVIAVDANDRRHDLSERPQTYSATALAAAG